MSANGGTYRSEAGLEKALREAGPRPAIPAEDLDLIRGSAREEWRELVAKHRPGRRPSYGRYLALAAALLVVVGLGWWSWSGTAPPALSVVATVELMTGRVEARYPAAESSLAALAPEGELFAGVELDTTGGGDGESSRIALALATGAGVRVDEETVLRLFPDGRMELEHGTVYVDTEPLNGAENASGQVEIVTPLGSVTDIGTRFEVRVEREKEDTLRVRVRQGSVVLRRDGQSIEVGAAEQIDLLADGTTVRVALDPFDAAWSWVLGVAPGFEIEGRPLREYLDWITRETGLEVRFASNELEASVVDARLFGSIEGLTPAESLDIVLPGSGLDWAIEEGAVLISEPIASQNS